MQHDWLQLKASMLPVQMQSDSVHHHNLETAERPNTPEEQQHVEQQAGFSFRMATGELVYALIVARIDISFAGSHTPQGTATCFCVSQSHQPKKMDSSTGVLNHATTSPMFPRRLHSAPLSTQQFSSISTTALILTGIFGLGLGK